MNTTLALLLPDGAVQLVFAERLTELQYAFLMNVVNRSESSSDLRRLVQAWARVEKLTVMFPEVVDLDSPSVAFQSAVA